jgi:hypothetical protein
MNKTKQYREESARDDFSTTGRHIHLLRIYAFVSDSVDFTEEENAHFDVCRNCRLNVIDALRTLAPQVVRTITAQAA